MIPEKDIGIQQKVIKVHRIGGMTPFLIQPEDIGNPGFTFFGILCNQSGVCCIGSCTDQVIADRGYTSENLVWLIDLLIQPELFYNCLYHTA